jgi:alginate O-acetyltransferase complex protein AlgI
MSFTQPLFLLYLAACAGLTILCPLRWRTTVILLASYGFYISWSLRAAAFVAALTLLVYGAAILGEPGRRSAKVSARIGITAALLLAACLIAFKVALLTPKQGIGGLVMPLGISYYTFKLISYVVEVSRGNWPAERNLASFASYVVFFPQIVAGPIQRPADFFSQIPPKPAIPWIALGRIASGLIKKCLVADNLAPTVNYIYGHLSTLHGTPLWLAFYFYPLQLYADFSGLTDIAIGAGQLFGITGPENFNHPFTASSVSDFWRRWHMSLTSWLRDYVFLPLRMATRQAGTLGLVFSIVVNMIAIALWHGLSLSYLIFGVLNGTYLALDALTSRHRTRFFKQHPSWQGFGTRLGWLLTFHLILVALVFFRATKPPDAIWLLGHLGVGLVGSTALLDPLRAEGGAHLLAVALAGYLILELLERYGSGVKMSRWHARAPRWVRWSLYASAAAAGVVGLGLLAIHSAGAKSPFIYEVF